MSIVYVRVCVVCRVCVGVYFLCVSVHVGDLGQIQIGKSERTKDIVLFFCVSQAFSRM